MQHEKLLWELEEEILSLIPPKSLARFRCVCKRWNVLFNKKSFVNKHLSCVRPQFILHSASKICSVEVNLDDPSIIVHNLPSYNYNQSFLMGIQYCDGVLIYTTDGGTRIGICNPWLKSIKWVNTRSYACYSGMGYDNTRSDISYKIFTYISCTATITNLESNAWKVYKFPHMNMCLESVSLNEDLYWIDYSGDSHRCIVQRFDFSLERFNLFCSLPCGETPCTIRSLAIFKGDRFSYLILNGYTNHFEIWVTKNKITKNREDVEWMKIMNVPVQNWPNIDVENSFPSYFIDDRNDLSLVLCSFNKMEKACVFIAKRDKFFEISITKFEDNHPRHYTYFPSLVPVLTTHPIMSHFTLPKGVEASDGRIGEKQWDDGYFDNVKKIRIGRSFFGVVFVKFYYSDDSTFVEGTTHGNSTQIRYDEILIPDDDYIEYVEGTYNDSHIISLWFELHKRKRTTYYYGTFDKGTPFLLHGIKNSKIIGFYGRSSNVHLTALGVHLSSSV
ncbi:unnamed protein product [Cochlearia groenlandica]